MAAKTLKLPAASTVTTAQLSAIIDLTEARIGQLVKEGILKRACGGDGKELRGRFHLFESIRAYIEYLRVRREVAEVSESELQAEKLRKLRVQCDIEELKLGELRAELHRTEHVERIVGDMVTAFRTKVLSMPYVAVPRLVEAPNEAAMLGILTEIAEAACVDLALIELGGTDIEMLDGEEDADI